MAIVLDAQLQHTRLFKKVANSIKGLCKEANFYCSERGMAMQSMDRSHVALVSVRLPLSAFSEYRCDRPVSLEVNVDSLTKIMKMTRPSDSLKIMHKADSDLVSFQCEGSDGRISRFDTRLMQSENEHLKFQSSITKWWPRCHPSSSKQSAGT